MKKPTNGCASSEDSDDAQADQSLLSAWSIHGSLATHWTHIEDSDQTGRMPRQIWAFTRRTLILLVLTWGGSKSLEQHWTFFRSCIVFFWHLSHDMTKPTNCICPVRSESLLCTQWVAKDPGFLHVDSEDWWDWADAQTDLGLRWAYSHFVCFFSCHGSFY